VGKTVGEEEVGSREGIEVVGSSVGSNEGDKDGESVGLSEGGSEG
jgi:hypothetical protein